MVLKNQTDLCSNKNEKCYYGGVYLSAVIRNLQ